MKYKELTGKRVKVTDVWGNVETGRLSARYIDWPCDLQGTTVLMLMGDSGLDGYLCDEDTVKEIVDEDN